MEPEVTPFAVQDAYGAPATLVPNHVGARTVREELYMTQKRILRDKRNAALAVSPAYLSELSTRLAAGGKMSLQAQTALRLVQDNDVDLVPRVTRLGTSISPPPSRRLGTWSRQQRTQRSKEGSLRRLCSRGSVFGEVLGRPAVLCTPAGPTTPMPVPPATAPPNLENPEQESETEDNGNGEPQSQPEPETEPEPEPEQQSAFKTPRRTNTPRRAKGLPMPLPRLPVSPPPTAHSVYEPDERLAINTPSSHHIVTRSTGGLPQVELLTLRQTNNVTTTLRANVMVNHDAETPYRPYDFKRESARIAEWRNDPHHARKLKVVAQRRRLEGHTRYMHALQDIKWVSTRREPAKTILAKTGSVSAVYAGSFQLGGSSRTTSGASLLSAVRQKAASNNNSRRTSPYLR